MRIRTLQNHFPFRFVIDPPCLHPTPKHFVLFRCRQALQYCQLANLMPSLSPIADLRLATFVQFFHFSLPCLPNCTQSPWNFCKWERMLWNIYHVQRPSFVASRFITSINICAMIIFSSLAIWAIDWSIEAYSAALCLLFCSGIWFPVNNNPLLWCRHLRDIVHQSAYSNLSKGALPTSVHLI